MLDYKKMSIEFDNLMKQVTKESFEAWVAFDEMRSIVFRMQNGEKVKFRTECHTNEVDKITCKEPTFNVGFLFYNILISLYNGTSKEKSWYLI